LGMVAEFADEVDNLAFAPVTVTRSSRPNLVVTDLQVPERLLTGLPIPIEVELSNTGLGDVPDRQVPFNVQVFLSRDPSLDPRSDRLLRTIRYDSVLEAGGVLTEDILPRMPSGLSGPYYVIARVDPIRPIRPQGDVAESNEDDNVTVSADPILIELPPPSDLVVDSIGIDPTSVNSDGTVTVTWTVRNAGDSEARGIWDDAIYLSTDATLGFGDRLLGRTGVLTETPNRVLQPGETYTDSLTTTLPPVLPGPYTLIVRSDVFDDVFEGDLRLNNDTPSSEPLVIITPELLLNVSETFALGDSGAVVYSVNVPAGETLEVTALAENASLELYAAFERVPNSADFDGKFPGALSGDQRLLIPRTSGGTYYILVRGNSAGDIQLDARLLPLQVSDVTPDRLGDASYVTIEIEGADFDPSATLKLVRPQFDEHIPVDYVVVDATRIVATFDLSGAELGLYDVVVTNPGGQSINVPHRVLVEAATELDADVGMGGPALVGFGESGLYNVTASSLTNIDTPYVQWSIHVPRIQNPEPTLIPGEAIRVSGNLGIDGGRFETGQDIDSVALVDGVYTTDAFLIDLPAAAIASSSFSVDIYPELPRLLEEDPDFLRSLGPGFLDALSFDFYVHASVTPLSAEDYIERQTDVAREARTFLLSQDDLRADLRTAISEESAWVNTYLAALRETGLLRESDVDPEVALDRKIIGVIPSLYTALETGAFSGTFDSADESGNLLTNETLAADVVALVRSIAGETPDTFSGGEVPAPEQFDVESRLATRQVAFAIRAGVPEEVGLLPVDSPDLQRFFVGTASSTESAALIGPAGNGTANFIPADTRLPFQVIVDQPLASGEAVHELRIVQAIDPALDVRTFQLSDITLGDLQIDVPGNRGAFTTEFDFSSDGFVLQVSAGVDVTTRTATWLLRAVDPATGLVIENPDVGLLRPGDTASVGYWISSDRDIPTGTSLETSARVFRDDLDPVETATYTGTLDTVAPTTDFQVTALSGDRYQIDWTATDDPTGSGVANSSVYVSRGGGSYLAIARRTTESSLVFQADPGEDVRFVVVSADNAGNVEQPSEGIFLPPYNPDINLGTPPSVEATIENPLPPESIPTDNAGNLVFRQLQDQITSNPTALRPSGYESTFEPFIAGALITGFANSGADIGPLAITLDPSGESLWVSGGAGRNVLYQLPTTGGTTDEALKTFVMPTPIYDLVFDGEGNLWASTGGGRLVSIETETGVVSNGGVSAADQVTGTLGLAVAPNGTQLYFATHEGISVLDLTAGTVSPFTGVRVDGMAFDSDGNLWAAAWPEFDIRDGGGQLVRFNERGIVVETIGTETPSEDIAFGPAGSSLEGVLLVSSEGSLFGERGDLVAIDLQSRQQTPLAMDGTRAESVAIGSDGTIFVGQSGQIDSLAPTAIPLVIASTPVDGGAASPGTRRSTLTFNVDMQADVTNGGGIDDADSYQLIDIANGQPIPINAVSYDVALRRVTLAHAPLASGRYELSIIGDVESVDGERLGTPFAAEFGVLADVTGGANISVARTQLNRRDGEVLFEATVMN
ncbi:MAG: CARDB domain-containing protein, partial [Planctomycetota bacterium]